MLALAIIVNFSRLNCLLHHSYIPSVVAPLQMLSPEILHVQLGGFACVIEDVFYWLFRQVTHMGLMSSLCCPVCICRCSEMVIFFLIISCSLVNADINRRWFPWFASNRLLLLGGSPMRPTDHLGCVFYGRLPFLPPSIISHLHLSFFPPGTTQFRRLKIC